MTIWQRSKRKRATCKLCHCRCVVTGPNTANKLSQFARTAADHRASVFTNNEAGACDRHLHKSRPRTALSLASSLSRQIAQHRCCVSTHLWDLCQLATRHDDTVPYFCQTNSIKRLILPCLFWLHCVDTLHYRHGVSNCMHHLFADTGDCY